MKRLSAALCVLALGLAAAAQDLPRFFDKLDLTAAQKEKVAALQKKHMPAIKELETTFQKDTASALDKIFSRLDDKQKEAVTRKELKYANFMVPLAKRKAGEDLLVPQHKLKLSAKQTDAMLEKLGDAPAKIVEKLKAFQAAETKLRVEIIKLLDENQKATLRKLAENDKK